jgi:hypothetical protein
LINSPLLLVDVRGPKKASNRISPWTKATTLMTQGRWLFCVQHLMRLTERNNAYETVKAVNPGQPEEPKPPPLEQQRDVVVSPHGT